MATDTWTLIDKRITQMADRNKRMDETAALLQWDDSPYKLVKPDGKTELRDAISVTPNLPKVFAHGVIADLLGGKWQTVVEGKVSGSQSHLIESFVEDALNQADEQLLTQYGIPSLFGWLCNHVCIRWAIGARWTSWVTSGEYQVDCLPVDMRWTPFVLGKWVAPIFFKSKDDLEQELEEYEKRTKDNKIGEYHKIPLPTLTSTRTTDSTGTDIEVRDYWDDKTHELWVAKQLAYSETNPFGYPPFAIAIPASGFMLRDKGYLKHEGEDILFLNAGLYKEFARSVSLEQTSGYAGLYPSFEYETKNMDGQPSRPVPELDQTQKVPEGELHQPVPRGDINRAGQTARVDIQQMIENGAPLSPRQYNTPPSAILLAGETEMISRLQNSRKEALGVFRSQLARMMLKQFLANGEKKAETYIGWEGKKRKYSASGLGNPSDYTITYHLSVKSKRQEMANLAEFAAVTGKLPLSWTLPNILMADDPDGIITALELERAKQADPAISLSEMGVKYAEEAGEMENGADKDLKNFQSMLLIDQAVRIIKQRIQPTSQLSPSPVPKIEEPKGDGRLLQSLTGQAVKGMAGERGNGGSPEQQREAEVIAQ